MVEARPVEQAEMQAVQEAQPQMLRMPPQNSAAYRAMMSNQAK